MLKYKAPKDNSILFKIKTFKYSSLLHTTEFNNNGFLTNKKNVFKI